MFLFGTKYDNSFGFGGVRNFPLHLKLVGDGAKMLGKILRRKVKRLGIDFDAHEKARKFDFGVLTSLSNPASVFSDKPRDRGNDARGVRAGETEGKGLRHGRRMCGTRLQRQVAVTPARMKNLNPPISGFKSALEAFLGD